MKNVLLLALVAFGLNSAAQKAAVKVSFQKGQKLEMVGQTNAVVTQEIMGNAMEMKINSTITRSFDVEDVAANNAIIEHKVKRVQFNFEGMGQSQNFDSEKEEDMNGEMGKSVEKTIKNKYKMTVDQAGNVVSVKQDDDNPNPTGNNESADMMSQMMSQFAEGLEVPKAGDKTAFNVLPAGGVTKGQSWTDSLTTGEKGFVKYTVSDINNSEVIIDYSAEGTLTKTQDAMGTIATVNMKSKTSGKITVDRKTGLLKQKTILGEGKGAVEVAGQSIPMTTKVSGTIAVKAL